MAMAVPGLMVVSGWNLRLQCGRAGTEWRAMKTVAQKHQGHWNYDGRIGNSESLGCYRTETCRILFKWLIWRSQRRSYT
jgi:hypothetical protein